MDQEQPGKQIAGDRLLKTLGIDPNKWTVGDRRIALLGVGIGLTIVIIAVCGYALGWAWTGLTEPKQRTFWDWLSLLIVPIVLALGGYLFNRSESRRTKDDADQRAQDEALQAYLNHIGELLLRKDKPLGQPKGDDEVRTLARARTLTVLRRLDGDRKAQVVQFLYESGLITGNHAILMLVGADLREADLSGANLREANLKWVNLSGANLRKANLESADLRGANLRGANLKWTKLNKALLEGTNMRKADLRGTYLFEAKLGMLSDEDDKIEQGIAYLSADEREISEWGKMESLKTDLRGANLHKSHGWWTIERAFRILDTDHLSFYVHLEGATMPTGETYEQQLRFKQHLQTLKNSTEEMLASSQMFQEASNEDQEDE